jgi:hypothetical protein
MVDDYNIILNNFKNVKGAKIKKNTDAEGNPILVVTLGNISMSFYFKVDDEGKAYFDNLIVSKATSDVVFSIIQLNNEGKVEDANIYDNPSEFRENLLTLLTKGYKIYRTKTHYYLSTKIIVQIDVFLKKSDKKATEFLKGNSKTNR